MATEGSSSSSSRCNRATEEEKVVMFLRCNCQATRKVSHSNQNPGRGYYKCMWCEKFVKWADEAKCDCDKKILKSFNEVKVELTEIWMMLKLIEKGQNIMLMLLVAVIIIVLFVMVVWRVGEHIYVYQKARL